MVSTRTFYKRYPYMNPPSGSAVSSCSSLFITIHKCISVLKPDSLRRSAAAALKYVYGLSVINDELVKPLMQMVLAHRTLRFRGNVNIISTASIFLNTFAAYGNSKE